MKKIIGYCRLSSKEQAEGITLAQQEDRLKKAGAEQIFTDLVSGRKDDRPGFLKVLGLASQGSVSKIICVRLDRYGRDGETIITTVLGLHKKGIKFQFLDDPDVDLDTDAGMFLLFVKAGLAQRESDQLSQRVKNGLNYLKNNNCPISGAPFGYVINRETKRYELDKAIFLKGKSKAEIAKEIIDTFLEVKTAKQTIIRINHKYQTKIMDSTYCCKWLANLVLRGDTVYNKTIQNGKKIKPKKEWDIRHNTHPEHALITQEEADLIDVILEVNSKTGPQPYNSVIPPKTYFTRLIYCASCGNQLTTRMSSSNKKYRYFFCRDSLCSNQASIREDKVNHAVITKILERSHTSTDLDNQLVTKSPALEKLENELEEVVQALSISPNNEFFLKAQTECLRKIQEEQLLNTETELWDKSSYEIIIHPALKSVGFLENLATEYRRLIYHKLIKNILIVDNKVKEVNLIV